MRGYVRLALMLAAIALALLLIAPAYTAEPAAADVQASQVTVTKDTTTVRVTVPSAGSPVNPDEPMLIRISVSAPAGLLTEVVIQEPGKSSLDYPEQQCRTPDAPDPEFQEWLICSGKGDWELELPMQIILFPDRHCQLQHIDTIVGISINNTRQGRWTLGAAYMHCRQVAFPIIQ